MSAAISGVKACDFSEAGDFGLALFLPDCTFLGRMAFGVPPVSLTFEYRHRGEDLAFLHLGWFGEQDIFGNPHGLVSFTSRLPLRHCGPLDLEHRPFITTRWHGKWWLQPGAGERERKLLIHFSYKGGIGDLRHHMFDYVHIDTPGQTFQNFIERRGYPVLMTLLKVRTFRRDDWQIIWKDPAAITEAADEEVESLTEEGFELVDVFSAWFLT